MDAAPRYRLTRCLLPIIAISCLYCPFARVVNIPMVLRPGSTGRRGRRLVDESYLFGNVHQNMIYHVDVLIGTPGQMQSVIVDTGSSMTAFPCTTCGSQCGKHLDPPFDPSKSSTFSWSTCTGRGTCKSGRCDTALGRCSYSVSYIEGSSIRGQNFNDVIHFGHHHRGNRQGTVELGCHTQETNLFRTQAPSGIMGLGERGGNIIQALADGPLDREIIALCMHEEGGAMTLGGVNESWTPLLQPLKWVPYTSSYYVESRAVDILGADNKAQKVEGFVGGSFHADSGTTFTYFTSSDARILENVIKSACGSGQCGSAVASSSRCWTVTASDIAKFPKLRFTIGTETYDWLPEGYLYKKHSLMCYAFLGDPPLTFGASFMRHSLFVFDRDAKKLGFAPAKCPVINNRTEIVNAPNGESSGYVYPPKVPIEDRESITTSASSRTASAAAVGSSTAGLFIFLAICSLNVAAMSVGLF